MKPASEFQIVRPGLAFWQAYDPAVKTELSCCAFETQEGLRFVDPVPLAAAALGELVAGRQPRGILLTSANHERASASLAQQYGLEVWAREAARGEVAADKWFTGGERVLGAEVVALEGFAPGETAYWVDGLLIFGDAVIHVPPYGFAMLPEKYCSDARRGRAALKDLVRLRAETLLFAHGLPVVARAAERLAGLVEAL